jgi:hypothetical protein
MNQAAAAPNSIENSPKMRFQPRDEEILGAMQRYGGVMARRQLKELFWPDKTWRAMEKRLAKLHRGGYLDWPTHQQWRSQPVPEPICWLGWRGALLLGKDPDKDIRDMEASNENRKRKLEVTLRKSGFHWLREPRWLQLKHDLRLVDFRMIVEGAIARHPSLRLGGWVLDRDFRSDPDVIEYQNPGSSGSSRILRKAILPDGFFSIQNTDRLIEGKPYTARFLVELDMSTEDNPRFAREKVGPSLAYLRSAEYQERFGYKSGRWLVIANGAERMRNLMESTRALLGRDARVFCFTTFDRLRPETALSAPIWHRGDGEYVGPLLEI